MFEQVTEAADNRIVAANGVLGLANVNEIEPAHIQQACNQQEEQGDNADVDQKLGELMEAIIHKGQALLLLCSRA